MVRWDLTTRILLQVAAAAALAACGTPDLHSAQDYASASSVGAPDGSLTTIVGPDTPVVKMTSTLRFPQGDIAPDVRSVLMYDRPASTPGACFFQAGYKAGHSDTIVKEETAIQPCDGKRPARFRIAGVDVAFVGHLVTSNDKGTPVTLFEISDHTVPQSIRVVY
jgi:hypothetical protein